MLFASILRLMPLDREKSRSVAVTLTLEDVYRDHFDFVFRQASRLGGPGIDAEDAAQEVFMVVARKLHTFDAAFVREELTVTGVGPIAHTPLFEAGPILGFGVNL